VTRERHATKARQPYRKSPQHAKFPMLFEADLSLDIPRSGNFHQRHNRSYANILLAYETPFIYQFLQAAQIEAADSGGSRWPV